MHDVIIVGAGTAGCVLAERLTRSGKLRVLLVEAGGKPESRFVAIPAAVPKLFRTECDWAFESEPTAAAAGRRIFTPRGRMLGGSSNLNFQIHQWCHPADFEGWVEQRGSKFWTSWDQAYTPVLATWDQGQAPQRGGWLQASYGKGHYTYFAYALHRQLPYGVPGAYRLLANLLSLGASVKQ